MATGGSPVQEAVSRPVLKRNGGLLPSNPASHGTARRFPRRPVGGSRVAGVSYQTKGTALLFWQRSCFSVDGIEGEECLLGHGDDSVRNEVMRHPTAGKFSVSAVLASVLSMMWHIPSMEASC